MNSELLSVIFYEAIRTSLIITCPLLLSILLVGLIISLFQAATQINEQTLSFIPKAISVIGVLMILGPWMLNILLSYMRNLFINLPMMIN